MLPAKLIGAVNRPAVVSFHMDFMLGVDRPEIFSTMDRVASHIDRFKRTYNNLYDNHIERNGKRRSRDKHRN